MAKRSPTGTAPHRITTTSTDKHPQLALLRLCQLVSPALPVGAYAYSQGLEYAVHAGWVHDETTTFDWLQGLARASFARLDLPILLRLLAAWRADDRSALARWNARLLASRETQELRDEDRHLGRALARVLEQLDIPEASTASETPTTYAQMYALACARWEIESAAASCGYLWSWLENQVLAAVKLVPLGQSAGQRLLFRLVPVIGECADDAGLVADADIGVGAVAQGIGSALHETQYTRLFRS